MPDASPRHPVTSPSWKRFGQRVFESAYLEIVVGALVLVSVILTLIEFMQVAQDSHPQAGVLLARINDGITAIFIVELGLRAIVARSKRRYLNEYFLDIVAVLPFWLILPGGRALRMLRLVRLLRMFGVVSRLSGHFPYVIRRGAVEYMMVMGLLVLTIVFATGAIMFFENQDVRDQPAFGLEDSFWFSIYSLFAGEPIPGPPQTLGGKIVAVFVMFMGLTIFAMFTGTVSAFMVQRIHMEGEFVDWDGLQDHVIICGWSTKAEIIIAEYRATPSMRQVPIVVVSEFDGDRAPVLPFERQKGVFFLNDDFTRVAALEKAGIHRA